MNIKENNSSVSISVGFTELLQLAFIILKLCNVINWSWWWVLSPTWISIAFVLVAIAIGVIIAIIKGD